MPVVLSNPTIVTQQEVVASGGASIGSLIIDIVNKHIDVKINYLDSNKNILKFDDFIISDTPASQGSKTEIVSVSGGQLILSQTPISSVYIVGMNQSEDFTISGNIISFVAPKPDGTQLTATYNYQIPATNNFSVLAACKTSGDILYNEIKKAVYTSLINMNLLNGTIT